MTDPTSTAPVASPAPAENTGVKGLLVTIYQRVILSYKTTLIGIAVAAVGVIVDQYVNSPNKVIATICLMIGGVLSLIKEQGIVKVPPTSP